MTAPTLPGATLGVLGSGQLGRMFAIAARRLGYRVHVFSPDDDTPTGQVADVEWRADYGDLSAVARFAEQVDVVTFEFENVPVETINVVDRHAPCRPAGEVLHTTQQRLREKTFLKTAGIPRAEFLPIRSDEDLQAVDPDRMLPGVLKTAAWGYDGKGQARVQSADELRDAWEELGRQEAVLEQFVNFELELSVVIARGQDGEVATYGPMVNSHRNHILDLSVWPSELPDRVVKEAIEIARSIVNDLNVVGVVCVEYFLANDGRLLVNEIAPRPHNSGHLTVDAHATCQFEQQVRAVCGLPLGSAEPLRPAAMANLLGDLWTDGEPAWANALQDGAVKLHLYGKQEPRPGRKMGHLTVLADTAEDAAQRALAARERLGSLPDAESPTAGSPAAKPSSTDAS